MFTIRIFFLLLPVLLFSIGGCSSKKHQLFSKHRTPVVTKGFYQQRDYVIKPHDRISILVYQYPELGTYRDGMQRDNGIEVTSRGTILLPLVGRIKVAGMTKEMLEDKLYRLYGEYLENSPAVKVDVLNKKVYVIGEVKNPGALEYDRQSFLTPLKAIAQRGGLTDTAKRSQVLIVRGNRKKYDVAVLDLTDMQSLAHYNIVLQPEDIVYVAHNSIKDINLPLNGMAPSLSLINTIFNSVAIYSVFK